MKVFAIISGKVRLEERCIRVNTPSGEGEKLCRQPLQCRQRIRFDEQRASRFRSAGKRDATTTLFVSEVPLQPSRVIQQGGPTEFYNGN